MLGVAFHGFCAKFAHAAMIEKALIVDGQKKNKNHNPQHLTYMPTLAFFLTVHSSPFSPRRQQFGLKYLETLMIIVLQKHLYLFGLKQQRLTL